MAKKNISGIICPGAEIGDSLNLPYCVVPDYIYSGNKIDCRDSFVFDFGIYGILSADKGVLEVAKFFSDKSYSLNIAGRIGDLYDDQMMADELKKIAEKSKNVSLSIGYLSSEKYEEYIKTTKYIVLNYSGVYMLRSSGVILDAIYAGKPVLAKRRKYVEFVEENGLGILYDDINDLDFDKLMDNREYTSFQYNIEKYLKSQNQQITKLKEFIVE